VRGGRSLLTSLVHRDSTRLQTGTRTSHKSSNDQMRHRESRGLQDCADNDHTHGKPDRPATPERLTDEEIDCSSQSQCLKEGRFRWSTYPNIQEDSPSCSN
jgi:hypothetical protein